MPIVEDVEFQEYVRDKLGTIELPILSRAKAAAESAVRRHCHRSFETPGDTPTARVFTPLSCELLFPDDIAALTSIDNDGSTLTVADYQLEPLNGRSTAGDSVPYDLIRRISGVWVVDGQRSTVSITATWGWETVPDAVKEAVCVLGKDIADRREMRGNVAGFGEFGSVKITSHPDALGLLNGFVRYDRSIGIA